MRCADALFAAIELGSHHRLHGCRAELFVFVRCQGFLVPRQNGSVHADPSSPEEWGWLVQGGL